MEKPPSPQDAVTGPWMTFLMAAVGVIAVGVPAAMLGAWLGWRSASPLPTEAQTIAITHDILPGVRLAGVTRNPSLFYYEHERAPEADPVTMFLVGDDDYRAGSTVVELASPLPATTETDERLTAAGWRVLGAGPDGLVASGNGLLLYVLPASSVESRPGPVVEILRDEPVPAPAFGITGLLVGGVLGFLLARWGHRQAQLVPPAVRRLVGAGAAAGSVLLLPTAVAVLIAPVDSHLLTSPGEVPYPSWDFYMFWGVRGITHLGWTVLALVLARLVLGVLRPDAGLVGRRQRPSTAAAARAATRWERPVPGTGRRRSRRW